MLGRCSKIIHLWGQINLGWRVQQLQPAATIPTQLDGQLWSPWTFAESRRSKRKKWCSGPSKIGQTEMVTGFCHSDRALHQTGTARKSMWQCQGQGRFAWRSLDAGWMCITTNTGDDLGRFELSPAGRVENQTCGDSERPSKRKLQGVL